MDTSQRKSHCFESAAASGVVKYIIDNDVPVCLKFNSFIKIDVVFDSFSTCIETESCDVEFALVTKQTEDVAIVVKSDCVADLQSSCHDNAHDGDEHGENSLQSIDETSELTAYRKKKGKLEVLGEIDSLRLPNTVKKNSTKKIKDRKIYKSEAENEQEHGRSEGCTEENGFVCSYNIEDASKSELQDKVYNTKLRSSNRLLKLNMKLHAAVQASKAAKTLLKSTMRKRTKTSQNYIAKQSTVPGQKLEASEKLSQSSERPRKLLMDKTVKCEYCTVDFHNQQAFYDHRRAEESTHKCGICGKVEPYEAHLIVHMQKHRRSKDGTLSHSPTKSWSPPAADCQEKSLSLKKTSKKEKMKCNICGLVVSSMDSLKIHTFLHTGEYAYRCCVCGENFSSLSSRQHHMDIHVSAERFKCNPCGKRFTSRAELAKHQLTHEIKCALCGEIFPNKTSRTCHFRVSHPSDILKCSLCSNLFATEEDLEKHLTYHKKGKKEQCPVCGVVVSKLKDHMLMHSQVAQEKLYACDRCPMRYLRKSNLDRHMRTHTGEKPYACNRCPKSFRSNGMLRKHLLTHTKEKPYQCEVCGKQCSLRSNLSIHMRVHSNDRSFTCPFCSQAFNHKNSLYGHMKNKHAQQVNLHERRLNANVHTVHQVEAPLPSSVANEVSKTMSFSHKHLENLAIPVTTADIDSIKVDTYHQDSQMYTEPNFAVSKPENITASNIFMLGDRYNIQSQSSHSHSY